MKTLKRFGLIHYVSKRMKYIVIYVNRTELEATIRKLKELHFVRQVEPSYRPLINMDFKEVLKKATPRKEVEEVEEFNQLNIESESQLVKNEHIIKEHEVRNG